MVLRIVEALGERDFRDEVHHLHVSTNAEERDGRSLPITDGQEAKFLHQVLFVSMVEGGVAEVKRALSLSVSPHSGWSVSPHFISDSLLYWRENAECGSGERTLEFARLGSGAGHRRGRQMKAQTPIPGHHHSEQVQQEAPESDF